MKNFNPMQKTKTYNLALLCNSSTIFIILFIFATAFNSFSQRRTIQGKVTTSDSEEPLPGVNVVIKGSIHGTITDVDGNYSIEVKDKDTVLVFS